MEVGIAIAIPLSCVSEPAQVYDTTAHQVIGFIPRPKSRCVPFT